ncbi:hypothetical protein LG52_3788 [Geobacillus kaustophilus]|uniref:Uncharacterized protein n=1 Tax=Geobacillus kaustophilus TaxID=1462 RepID=A0A0D8C7E1_GEOKU|nr:hypothetical protein LG52_3792 [Geobacillus kaustophilus]KJE32300.1 hypothetical protein LG52_3788 [Geobacillus kaustophilus]
MLSANLLNGGAFAKFIQVLTKSIGVVLIGWNRFQRGGKHLRTIPAPIALYLYEQVHRLMENRQIPYFSCPSVVDRGSGKPTMRATFLCLCFLYMNRITIGKKFLFNHFKFWQS